MPCKQCGMCCRAIGLSYTREHIKSLARKGHKDSIFILKYWRVISRRKAEKINPHLKTWKKVINFYQCSLLDQKTNLCTVQNSKPNVCKMYPGYGRPWNTYKVSELYTLDCGYAEEIYDSLNIDDEGRRGI